MAHLDRVEAEGRDPRNPFGEYKLSENEEEEEGSEDLELETEEVGGVAWGVRSDGDVRHSIGGGADGGRSWKERVRETLSFDLERSNGSTLIAQESGYRTYRNRSGSVGNLTSFARRPSPHGRHASAGVDEDNGEDSDWLHVAPEEDVRKKIVVFEVRHFLSLPVLFIDANPFPQRLESVEVNPTFTW